MHREGKADRGEGQGGRTGRDCVSKTMLLVGTEGVT
jgi:hypothetical protein